MKNQDVSNQISKNLKNTQKINGSEENEVEKDFSDIEKEALRLIDEKNPISEEESKKITADFYKELVPRLAQHPRVVRCADSLHEDPSVLATDAFENAFFTGMTTNLNEIFVGNLVKNIISRWDKKSDVLNFMTSGIAKFGLKKAIASLDANRGRGKKSSEYYTMKNYAQKLNNDPTLSDEEKMNSFRAKFRCSEGKAIRFLYEQDEEVVSFEEVKEEISDQMHVTDDGINDEICMTYWLSRIISKAEESGKGFSDEELWFLRVLSEPESRTYNEILDLYNESKIGAKEFSSPQTIANRINALRGKIKETDPSLYEDLHKSEN